MTKHLVDSNILIYSVHKNEKKKHEISSALIIEMVDANKLVLSIQNLAEFSRVMAEKVIPQHNKRIIWEYVYGFSKSSTIIYYNAQTIMEALHISKEYETSFFDSLIAATMQENGIDNIITENENDFSKIPWLTVSNPFK